MAGTVNGRRGSQQGSIRKPLVIVVIVIAIVAILGFSYASPYMTLDRLKRAADARDAATVDQYVDFPALRESLKQQVTALLAQRLDAKSNGNPLAALGAMIGVALIGPLVDAYATPDGVAALLNGIPPRGEPGERPPVPSHADSSPATDVAPAPGGTTPPSTQPPQPPQTTAGYRGLNEFVITYRHGVGDTRYSAILHRDGLFSWKLSAVDLNGR
ncbi:DUF2939 domain-containing protein [Paraburkholderia megapolitana]|uniref:DUF2939 domain-containing protein n=1 Tax=Paraburkholderia megapolitana TaxID=420953 RepID=UPI0038B8B0C8